MDKLNWFAGSYAKKVYNISKNFKIYSILRQFDNANHVTSIPKTKTKDKKTRS